MEPHLHYARLRSRNHILFFSSPEASVRVYSVLSDRIVRNLVGRGTPVRLGESAVSRDGTLIAIEDRLYSSEMTSLGTLPILQDFVGGLVFDPLQDVLYAADKKLDAIRVFSTPDLQEIGRFPDAIDLSPTSSGLDRIRPNPLTISDDGRLLFVATEIGVWMLDNPFAVPEPQTMALAFAGLLGSILIARDDEPDWQSGCQN